MKRKLCTQYERLISNCTKIDKHALSVFKYFSPPNRKFDVKCDSNSNISQKRKVGFWGKLTFFEKWEMANSL